MIILTFIYALSGCIISNNMSCIRQFISLLTSWKYLSCSLFNTRSHTLKWIFGRCMLFNDYARFLVLSCNLPL